MADAIERYFLAIERRARLLEGLARLWPLKLGALLLTLGYLSARAFELPIIGEAEVGAHWLILGNLLIAAGGFLWGYRAPVKRERLLYLVDRRLRLGERLSSLWELHRGRGPRELIPLISRELPELGRLPLGKALPLRRRERLGLALLGLLAVLCLGLGLSPGPLLPLSGLPWKLLGGAVRLERGNFPSPELGLRPRLEVLQRLAIIEEELTQFEGVKEVLGTGRLPSEEELELHALQKELAQLEGGPLRAQGEKEGGAEEGGIGSHAGAQKGFSLEEFQERLAGMLSALEGLEPGSGEPPPLELEERLAQLAEELGLGAELAEMMAKAGAGEPPEAARLAQLQQELAMRLRLEGVERLQRLKEWLASPVQEGSAQRGGEHPEGGQGQAPREGRPGLSSPSGEGDFTGEAGPAQEEGQAEPTETGPEAGAGTEAMRASGFGLGPQGQPGKLVEGAGEEAGTSPGSELEQGQGGEPLFPPEEARELRISGVPTELGEIERLITKGVPFESEPEGMEGGERAALRLDFHQVQAILSSRGLPEELQELVKRYFLAITETGTGSE